MIKIRNRSRAHYHMQSDDGAKVLVLGDVLDTEDRLRAAHEKHGQPFPGRDPIRAPHPEAQLTPDEWASLGPRCHAVIADLCQQGVLEVEGLDAAPEAA